MGRSSTTNSRPVLGRRFEGQDQGADVGVEAHAGALEIEDQGIETLEVLRRRFSALSIEADDRQPAVRIHAARDVFTRRRPAPQTVLRGQQAHHIELRVAQHIDGVASVRTRPTRRGR